MSANSSSSSFSFHNHFYHCVDSTAGLCIFTTFTVTKTSLVLPLSVLVFHLGHRRWRQQRSFATTSHSDVFTYHMAANELLSALGSTVYICGSYSGLAGMAAVGTQMTTVVYPGHLLFHVLTCVDRYLAVVHPVTYVGLKQSSGVKIRDVSAACVWLLSCLWIGTLYGHQLSFIALFSTLVFAIVVVSFCSLRVLCVLARPGPGDVEGGRRRVDPSKQRAFHTVTAITGALWLWFAGFLACLALDASLLLSYSDGCLVLVSGIWFGLPSSLVLPLLFLQRAGRPVCCH